MQLDEIAVGRAIAAVTSDLRSRAVSNGAHDPPAASRALPPDVSAGPAPRNDTINRYRRDGPFKRPESRRSADVHGGRHHPRRHELRGIHRAKR